MLRNFSRLFGSDTGTAEEKAREGPRRLLQGASQPPFPLFIPWLRASLGRGPEPATGQWGLERKGVEGEVSSLKVTLSCSSDSRKT